MNIEVVGFTGYENKCEIYYYDSKGEYIKSRILDNIDFDLKINIRGNYAVTINSCVCTLYDDLMNNGVDETLVAHETYTIEKAMAECVDWEAWEQENQSDVDDFLISN